jgi:plasmid stabilization system protein ParE
MELAAGRPLRRHAGSCLCRIGAFTYDFTGLRSYPVRYRRYRVEWHMIYFRITTYGIAIIRILHGRMEALRQL